MSDFSFSIAHFRQNLKTFYVSRNHTEQYWDKPDYPFEKIQENMFATGYGKDKFHFIKGKVEDTLPGQNPGPIALLRLDTDWYESTYHELVHLYPLLVKNGILIIDDYGHFKGAKEAVEQYFQEQRLHPLLHRLDYTGRLVMKI